MSFKWDVDICSQRWLGNDKWGLFNPNDLGWCNANIQIKKNKAAKGKHREEHKKILLIMQENTSALKGQETLWCFMFKLATAMNFWSSPRKMYKSSTYNACSCIQF